MQAKLYLRSHASVRSYFFRERIAEAYPHQLSWPELRCVWRKADAQAREWRRRATNVWNDATRQWEQRT